MECNRCGEKSKEFCSMCQECFSCCCFGGELCKGCGGHPDGDEEGNGYCCDCTPPPHSGGAKRRANVGDN